VLGRGKIRDSGIPGKLGVQNRGNRGVFPTAPGENRGKSRNWFYGPWKGGVVKGKMWGGPTVKAHG